LDSCKASCHTDPSCPGITMGAHGGVANNCVKCSSVASTGAASGWTTHVKPVLWSALSNQYCNANWAADWAARTQEPLDSCKASCDADPSCPGITMGAQGGANYCVKCSSVASTGGAGGWTTHVKLAPAQTTTTATTTGTTTATTTTVASTTPSTTSSAATTTTATTTAAATTTTATSTTVNVGSQLSQIQEQLNAMQTHLVKLDTVETLLAMLQAQMAEISSLLNSTFANH